LESHTPKGNQWGCMQAYGMQMTGLQEGALWRQTGLKLPLPFHTETSMPKLVLGLMESLLAITQLITGGTLKSWILQVKNSWNGCGRIIWFTITVQTLSDSLRASLLNAMPPRSRGSIACSHIELFFHVISSFPD